MPLSLKDRRALRKEECRVIIDRLMGDVYLEPKPATREELRAVIDYFGIELCETGGFNCEWTPEIDTGSEMQMWINDHADEVYEELQRIDRAKNCTYLRVVK